MAKPQNMAAIMKKSDLEEEDSPVDSLCAIACLSPETGPRALELSPRETRPRGRGAALHATYVANYWPGRSSCVNPVVLMVRNIGVRGGNNKGFRKFESKI